LNRSPGARRKAKAPPPPSSQQIPNEQINNQTILTEQATSESNQYLTGNEETNDKGTKSVEETSTQSNQFKNIYKRFTKGFFFLRSLFLSTLRQKNDFIYALVVDDVFVQIRFIRRYEKLTLLIQIS
jgi:hypothetical protein